MTTQASVHSQRLPPYDVTAYRGQTTPPCLPADKIAVADLHIKYPNIFKRHQTHKRLYERKRGHDLFDHGKLLDEQTAEFARLQSADSSSRGQIKNRDGFDIRVEPLPFHSDDIARYRQRWKDIIELDESRYRKYRKDNSGEFADSPGSMNESVIVAHAQPVDLGGTGVHFLKGHLEGARNLGSFQSKNTFVERPSSSDKKTNIENALRNNQLNLDINVNVPISRKPLPIDDLKTRCRHSWQHLDDVDESGFIINSKKNNRETQNTSVEKVNESAGVADTMTREDVLETRDNNDSQVVPDVTSHEQSQSYLLSQINNISNPAAVFTRPVSGEQNNSHDVTTSHFGGKLDDQKSREDIQFNRQSQSNVDEMFNNLSHSTLHKNVNHQSQPNVDQLVNHQYISNAVKLFNHQSQPTVDRQFNHQFKSNVDKHANLQSKSNTDQPFDNKTQSVLDKNSNHQFQSNENQTNAHDFNQVSVSHNQQKSTCKEPSSVMMSSSDKNSNSKNKHISHLDPTAELFNNRGETPHNSIKTHATSLRHDGRHSITPSAANPGITRDVTRESDDVKMTCEVMGLLATDLTTASRGEAGRTGVLGTPAHQSHPPKPEVGDLINRSDQIPPPSRPPQACQCDASCRNFVNKQLSPADPGVTSQTVGCSPSVTEHSASPCHSGVSPSVASVSPSVSSASSCVSSGSSCVSSASPCAGAYRPVLEGPRLRLFGTSDAPVDQTASVLGAVKRSSAQDSAQDGKKSFDSRRFYIELRKLGNKTKTRSLSPEKPPRKPRVVGAVVSRDSVRTSDKVQGGSVGGGITPEVGQDASEIVQAAAASRHDKHVCVREHNSGSKCQRELDDLMQRFMDGEWSLLSVLSDSGR